MKEDFERHPEMEEEHPLNPPRRALGRALGDILDSAASSYRETSGRSVTSSIALLGDISREELSVLIDEMPVVAEIALAKDFGRRALILFDISTATRLANYIVSGKVEKDLAAGGQHISSLHEFVNPIVDSFSAACEEAANRAFGSLERVIVCDRSERERLLEHLSDSLVRAVAVIHAGGEAAGKIALVVPSNVCDILAESKEVSSRISVSPYEQMELEDVDETAGRPAPHILREPSMENIGLILDIQLRLSARLGQVEMPIGEIMKLAPGSVIDIDRLVDEPIELVVNDRPIARGEIVVVQENFGIKITEIISQKERIRTLG